MKKSFTIAVAAVVLAFSSVADAQQPRPPRENPPREKKQPAGPIVKEDKGGGDQRPRDGGGRRDPRDRRPPGDLLQSE